MASEDERRGQKYLHFYGKKCSKTRLNYLNIKIRLVSPPVDIFSKFSRYFRPSNNHFHLEVPFGCSTWQIFGAKNVE